MEHSTSLAPARAYDEPSALVMYDGTVITSSEGVRQGDPLGPLLFSLAIRHSLEQLQQQLRSATRKGLPPPIIVAYLDDVYILSGQEIRPEKLADYLQHAPITLNIQKTKSYPLAELRQTGLKALGSFVGPLDGRKKIPPGQDRRVATGTRTATRPSKTARPTVAKGKYLLATPTPPPDDRTRRPAGRTPGHRPKTAPDCQAPPGVL